MKKVIALTLALVLALALVACGGNGDKGGATSNLTEDELVEKLTAICDGKTGEMMVENIALTTLAENAGGKPADFFGTWFPGASLPDGTLVAINQAMMMGQPHIVFLIQPAGGTSAEDYAKELEGKANPNWNVCTTANFVKCEVKDGLILFVMTTTEEGSTIDAQGIIDAFNA